MDCGGCARCRCRSCARATATRCGTRPGRSLLDAAWADAPPAVRQFAALSLRAHLEKLREEGRA
jgi:hypothetical protein